MKQKNMMICNMDIKRNIKQRLSAVVTLLLAVWVMPVYAAEYVYISDNLRVGVRAEPVSGVPPIGVVFTGMRLEVHEKVDGYVKISTSKGVTGWIKDIYVTNKAPALIELKELKKKYEKLQKDLSKGGDTTAMLEKANKALSEEISELKKDKREWVNERASLMASQYQESSFLWVFVMLVLVCASFAAGIFWYKNHVMKRLGGLRV